MDSIMVNKLTELLGVEIGEEFLIEGHDLKHMITEDGIICSEVGIEVPLALNEIIFKGKKIIKIPWKPEVGKTYYFINTGKLVFPDKWKGRIIDYERFRLGNCFKTEQKAEQNIDNFYESLKNFYENS